MTLIRYAVVVGIKDVADRFLPICEFYLRGVELDEAKKLFKRLPEVPEGNYVFRLYERYYDKHTEQDTHYQKSEFTREADHDGFHKLIDKLIKLQEESLEE